MYYLGLDIGTSGLKTTLIDDTGNICYEKSYSYAFEEPRDGFREIDPDVWFQAVLESLRELLVHYDERELSCIGVTGQMHTTVFLDAQGKSVRKAIMWNDLRSVELIPTVKEEISHKQETRYIAKILSPGTPAMNMLWLKENEADSYQKTCHILSAYDYIVYRLSGVFSLDYCDASTSSLYDIQTKRWSSWMLNKLGITSEMMGTLHASCDVVGTILPQLCESLGITHEVHIIAGTGDNPANALAMGILNQRQPVISLGTSGVVIIPKDDQDFEGKGKNVLFSAFTDEYVNVVQGTVRSAGGTHKWWIKNIVQSQDMTIDQDQIHEEDLGHNSILFFPHITGDKLIYQDIDIRGAFIGLSAGNHRKDMTQAVFEGVGFALREVLEHMGLNEWPKQIRINGGGTQSPIWMDILANILHTDLEVVTQKATPGYGAALLAYMSVHQSFLTQTQTGSCIYKPKESVQKAYEKQYETYKRIYHALKEIDQ